MAGTIKIPITFILSTGRTGTQFFSRYLTDSCHDILCLHEPKPSRRFKWYSNYYLSGKLSEEFIARQYYKTRRKTLQQTDFSKYVESSNFMFGCLPGISHIAPYLSVIHLVREPASYIKSHLNKGFWHGIKGFTARNIPGWVEFLDPAILRSGDPVWILAARWIYVNRVIQQYRDQFPYLLIRFEDLFGEDIETGIHSLNRIREFLHCPGLTEDQQKHWLNQPANQSKKQYAQSRQILDKHLEYLHKEGGDLLKEYNYSPEEHIKKV